MVARPLASDRDAKALEIARKLSKHTYVMVREYAFAALWSSPDQEASYNALASALADDSYAVRIAVVRALDNRPPARPGYAGCPPSAGPKRAPGEVDGRTRHKEQRHLGVRARAR